MFQKILLPVDLADKHQAALESAANLARLGAGDVTLLHVIEVIPGLPMEEDREFYQRLEGTARKHLQQLGEFFEGRAIPWHSEIRFGQRGPDIVRYAHQMEADLIVLTAPPFDPEHPAAGWGSLSYKVGMFAPCPVLLVK
jgi:nucleotide-binding universal stress UspA family protein